MAEEHLVRAGWPVSGRRLLAGASLAVLFCANASAADARAPADSYVHTRYTVDDGLPTNLLTKAVATPDGYLWIGTQDGLVRYDGHRFAVFNTGNVEAFPDNRITNLALAPPGDLWILTQSALLRHRAGRFERFDQHPDLGGAHPGILATPEGTRFVTRTGLYRYRDGGFEALVEGKWNGSLLATLVDRDGALWLGFRHAGAVRLEGREPRYFTRCQGRPLDSIWGFFERPDGNVWMRTEHYLCSFQNGQEGEILPIESLPGWEVLGSIYSYHHDVPSLAQPGELVGHDRQGRLRQVDPARWLPAEIPLAWDSFQVYAGADRRATRIGLITAVARDREGGTWFTTEEDGLHSFRPVPIVAYGAEEGLPDRAHYAVAEDKDGSIFAAGATTVSRLDGQRFEPLLEHRSQSRYLGRDRANELWFAGAWDALYRFTGEGFEPFLSPRLPHSPTVVWRDLADTLWFGTEDGLHALQGGVWSHYGVENALPFPPSDLYETRDGALWLKHREHGLARLQDGRFAVLDIERGLPGNDVRYLYEDGDGILWLAIYGFGLVRVDLGAVNTWGEDAFHRAHLTHYRQRDGLFDDSVSSVVEDGHGRLWLSSNRGIFWVQKADLEAVAAGRAERFHVASYGVEDGMRHREANGGTQAAALVASDGRLWFPTMDGVVAIDPDAIDREPPPAVLFEQVRAGGEALLPTDGAIELGATQRSFEVEITVPVFAAPEQVRFRYRLAGYDDAWQKTTRRRLTYTRVPGGSYTLQVEAKGRSGLWSEAVSEMRLRIEPYFYETWWFRALTALVAVLAVASVVRLRVRRLLERERELEALVRERTADLAAEKEKVAAEKETVAAQAEQLATLDRAKSRFFANISHEFRTPLTLLIGPLEDSLAGRPDALSSKSVKQSMLRNSRRLLRLVEQLLDLARFEADEQQLEPAVGDLGALVRRTVRSFVPLAERLGVELIHEAAELPPLCFDRDKLEKVVTNLISNACKFTPAGGRVEVVLEADDDRVEIAVQDTGSGISAADLPRIFERFYHTDERRPAAQPSTGLGLSLARELTRLHGGTLEVESTPGQGSTFTVRLPRAALAAPERSASPAPDTASSVPVEPPLEPAGGLAERPSDAPALGTAGDGEAPTVLVVDDNADVRRYVGSILGGEYRIKEAEDGEQGLGTARSCSPDLIVSDVMMPGLDGHALARALKKDPMTEGIPIILLTARAAPADEVAGLESGVDCYLTKPFEGAVLEARVRNLIAQRLRLRDLYRQGWVAENGLPPARGRSALEERVRTIITSRLTDDGFNVEALAAELTISRSQLFRRLRDEAGTTPSDLIRTVRLEKAVQLLQVRAGNVTEVAYAVGFNNLSYFTRCFREHFQALPSAFFRDPNRGISRTWPDVPTSGPSSSA